jgi:signal transduction histidine kinase
MSEATSSIISQYLEKFINITQTVSAAKDWKTALDQIVPIVRETFIFDNLVFYLADASSPNLDASYARAVGRGRSVGAEITWGDLVANQVIKTQTIHLQQPPKSEEKRDRLEQPFVLGLPVKVRQQLVGVLVFIRFGGPVFDKDNINVALLISEEISHLFEKRQLKDEISFLEAEKQVARLQENFISTISHELLTPLGFIKGYATTLLRSDISWDETSRHEFLTIIDEETDRLQELIDNLLDSSRLQSGAMRMEFQPVRLDALIRDVIMRARMQHTNLQVLLKLDGPTQPIQGDPRRLSQVIDNLLSNAIKYAPGAAIVIGLNRENDSMKITFQDNGPGIPAQYLSHLFERFFRNPEQAVNVRGTGLGLYICRQIIEAHMGKITIESYVGDGTTFFINLPCEQKSAETKSDSHKKQKGACS